MFFLLTVNNTFDCDELEALISDIAQKNTDAMAELYNKTKASVYGYALSVLKDPHDAEDVLQSCFVNIYNYAFQYKSNGKPMAWIITVAKNLSYQKLRERNKTVDITDGQEKTMSVQMTADDRLLVQFCLEMLSDDERQILILHAVSDFKHREIAKLLRMPLGTVLSKYNRAIKKINEHFKGEDNND